LREAPELVRPLQAVAVTGEALGEVLLTYRGEADLPCAGEVRGIGDVRGDPRGDLRPATGEGLPLRRPAPETFAAAAAAAAVAAAAAAAEENEDEDEDDSGNDAVEGGTGSIAAFGVIVVDAIVGTPVLFTFVAGELTMVAPETPALPVLLAKFVVLVEPGKCPEDGLFKDEAA